MSHKIAIITVGYKSYDYDEYGQVGHSRVVESITDWDEVTDEEFKYLRAMESKLGYHVIERPSDTPSFISKTVADYKVYVKAEKKRMAAEKEKREKEALARKIKKEAKTKVEKEKMLAKLADELGVDITGLPKAVLPK